MQSVALSTDVCSGTADKLFGFDVASGQSGSSFWTVDAAGDHWGGCVGGGLGCRMTHPCTLAPHEFGGGVPSAVEEEAPSCPGP